MPKDLCSAVTQAEILNYLSFFNYSKKITAFKALIPLSKYSFEILSMVKEHSF
jgi:hypothetical protein